MKKYRKSLSLLIVFPFLISTVSFAGQGRMLSDYELDQVHAGGLNLDFDKFLGSFPNTSETGSAGGLSDASSGLGGGLVVYDNKGSRVQIVEIKTPKVPELPKAPAMPETPDMPNAPQMSVSNVSDLPDLPDLFSIPSTPETPITDADQGLQSVVTVAPDMSVANNATPELDAAMGAADNSFGGTTPQLSVVPVSPTTPTAPQAPTPVMTFDVIAGRNNGDFKVAVSDNSALAASGPIFTAASPNSQNFLNVTDTEVKDYLLAAAILVVVTSLG